MSRMNYRWSCPDRNSIVGRKKNNKNNWRRKKGRLVGNLVWCREEIREDNLYYFCLMSNFRLYLRPIFMTKKSYLYEIWFPILNMEISQGGFWVHITSVKTTRYWKENIHSRRHNQVNKNKIIKLKRKSKIFPFLKRSYFLKEIVVSKKIFQVLTLFCNFDWNKIKLLEKYSLSGIHRCL